MKKEGADLGAKRVGAGKTTVKQVKVGSKHPIQPSPKYQTPKKFGAYFGKK